MSKLIMKLAAWRLTPASRHGSERGAVAVEYGVLVAAVGVALFAGALLFFGGLSTWFGELVEALPPN